MGKLRIISLLTCIISLSACATTGKSTAAGAGVGAVVVGTAGALADSGPDGSNRMRNVVIGSAIGAGLGAAGGYFFGKHAETERENARAQGRKDAEDHIKVETDNALQGDSPRLVPAKTEAKWVPDAVKGGTFIPGHFEYIIVQPAHWESGR